MRGADEASLCRVEGCLYVRVCISGVR
jgi:hypothetical protein